MTTRDNFGNLKTADSFTLFNYYPTPYTGTSSIDSDILMKNTNGSATISYVSTSGAANYINLDCSASGGNAIVQTKQPMDYLSGKSQLIYLTGVLLSRAIVSGETVTSRIGLYDVDSLTNNPPTPTAGTYFQTDGTNLQFADVVQGTTPNIVNQSSWNYDTFNGSGPSGLTLIISNANTVSLIFIERAWLGVGIVKVGFVINGIGYLANTFTHDTLSVQYTSIPRQQITYQIVATTLTPSAGDIANRMMCFTNISKGGFFPLGRRNSFNTGNAGVSLASTANKYILFALKINSTYTKGTIKMIKGSFGFKASTGTMGLYEIHLVTSTVGTITGTLTYSSLTNSIVQYANGNGTQTLSVDGYKISSGFLNGNTNINFNTVDYETLLNRVIVTANSGDTLCIVGNSNGNNDIMFASIDFIESL